MQAHRIVLVVGVLTLMPGAHAAAQGEPDLEAGQAAFGGGVAYCSLCHGSGGQGGRGPDLAGTGLTFDQFKRAVTEPWGLMPSFPTIDDGTLRNMHAWLSSLARSEEPTPARTVIPAGSPEGQRLSAAYGCGQCHGAELSDPRRDLGAYNGDFEFLKRIIYDGARPTYEPAQGTRPNRMGIFSRRRLPEPVLEQIYEWMRDETGLRVPLIAEIHADTPENGNTTYTLTVENETSSPDGLAAEDLTVSLPLPPDADVIDATGETYQGVRQDAETQGDAAVWHVSRIGPGERLQLTLTLAGATVPEGIFQGAAIRWTTPAITRPASQTVTDPRIPETGDWISTTGFFQAPNGVIRPLIITPEPRE